MGAPKIAVNALYSYDDYLTWNDEERWELIYGTPYSMAPAPFREHQEISGRVHNIFFTYLKDKSCKVYAAPFDVRFLPENCEKLKKSNSFINSVVQPDLTIVCDPSKLDKRGCIGSPDLIVEITSKSTIKKDITQKFALYEKFKVKEYWIIHPESKTVLIFKLVHDSYGKPDMYAYTDIIESALFPGLTVNLQEVFGIEPEDEENSQDA